MDDATQRLIKSLENEIKKMPEDSEAKAAALLRLEEIAKAYTGEDRVVSSEEIAKELKENPPKPGVMTGLEKLDFILNGFTPQQVIVLAGLTKNGKTAFAIDLTARMKADNPLWFPFEESAQELIQKFLDRGDTPPLFYTPLQTRYSTLDWIETKIVEAKAKYGSKVVFIDHLGFITPRSDSEAQEIGRVMRGLKTMAKKWNVVIVLLCHLVKTQIDRHPNLEDLRGSAAIGQEADTVMFIWRETTKERGTGEVKTTNNVNISVQANRRTGRTGNVKMKFKDGKYEEFNWTETEKDKEFNDW